VPDALITQCRIMYKEDISEWCGWNWSWPI